MLNTVRTWQPGHFTLPGLTVGTDLVRLEKDGLRPASVTRILLSASALATENAKNSVTIDKKLLGEFPLVAGGALRSTFTRRRRALAAGNAPLIDAPFGRAMGGITSCASKSGTRCSKRGTCSTTSAASGERLTSSPCWVVTPEVPCGLRNCATARTRPLVYASCEAFRHRDGEDRPGPMRRRTTGTSVTGCTQPGCRFRSTIQRSSKRSRLFPPDRRRCRILVHGWGRWTR
jgi:hypothetical protein